MFQVLRLQLSYIVVIWHSDRWVPVQLPQHVFALGAGNLAVQLQQQQAKHQYGIAQPAPPLPLTRPLRRLFGLELPSALRHRLSRNGIARVR
jgi:hypothetical protein